MNITKENHFFINNLIICIKSLTEEPSRNYISTASYKKIVFAEDRQGVRERQIKIVLHLLSHIRKVLGWDAVQTHDFDEELENLCGLLLELTTKQNIQEEFLVMSIIREVNDSFFKEKFIEITESGKQLLNELCKNDNFRYSLFAGTGLKVESAHVWDALKAYEQEKTMEIATADFDNDIMEICRQQWKMMTGFYFDLWVRETAKWVDLHKNDEFFI
ncbi:MAG: hypothetical protein LWY06_01360 [Firmicutes bacterium]|nr:hypothetical protein [Bacillota bacterium]